MNTTLLGLVIVVAAPNLKEPPKRVPEIVGQWVVESVSLGGSVPAPAPVETVFEFTASGQWLIKREGVLDKSSSREVQYDAEASPPTIDGIHPQAAAGNGGRSRNFLGIYKVDGDTLTICFGGPNEQRPTKFESEDGSRVVLMTFTRAKKKD
jgi:uncharacterized protein (TIGR03067 family)